MDSAEVDTHCSGHLQRCSPAASGQMEPRQVQSMTPTWPGRGHHDILALDWTHWNCSSTARWSCRPPPSTRGRSCCSDCCNADAAAGGSQRWHCQTEPADEGSHDSAPGGYDRHDVWTTTILAAEPHCSSGRHWATQSAAGIDFYSGNCCADDSWEKTVLLRWQSGVHKCYLGASLRRSGMTAEDDGKVDLRCYCGCGCGWQQYCQ